jgi:hypothetical protein
MPYAFSNQHSAIRNTIKILQNISYLRNQTTPCPFHHSDKLARIPFMIETQVDRSRKLTIFTVSGTVTAREFAIAIRSFYAGEITLHALWDFRQGNVELTEEEIWNLARSVSTLNLSTRRGGKTAFVAEEGSPFGLAKMYQLITDTMSLPFEIKVFTNLEDANHWLGGGDGPAS